MNIGKVSTLYLDAPVLDITSWPGGYGSSERYEKKWAECKEVYKLTEKTALEFKDSPIHKIDLLLEANVKIMLVARAVDSVVPYAENGKKLAEYYVEKGGDSQIILKPNCDHHSHSLENPAPIVEYIIKNFRQAARVSEE